jgi:hypothetical protein
MEGQPSNSTPGLGKHISNAIANAVSIAVKQGLQDANLTDQAVLAFSAMSRTIGQTVAAAIKSSIEDSGPKPIVTNAVALREQTLGTPPPHLFPPTHTNKAPSKHQIRARRAQRRADRRTIQVLRTGSHRRLRWQWAFLRRCGPDRIHPSPRKKGGVCLDPSQRLRVQH